VSLRHAILGVLEDGPLHGYQIATQLERRVLGGHYNSAQVYQGLRWLAAKRFVVSEAPEPGINRERRPFRITPRGRSEFGRWLVEPIVPARPLRDEAVMKLVFLGPRHPEHLLTILERLRRSHLRRLAGSSTSSRAPAAGSGNLFARLTATALRFREQAEISWIEHSIEEVRRALDAGMLSNVRSVERPNTPSARGAASTRR